MSKQREIFHPGALTITVIDEILGYYLIPLFRQTSISTIVETWNFQTSLCFDNPIFRQLSKHWDVEILVCRSNGM